LYEHQTYEAVLTRLLDRIPADIDKREGSIIYDTLSPAALELAQMYTELDVFLRLLFADTSSGEYLSRRTAEFGVNRKAATYAIRKGVFTDSSGLAFDVAINHRFRLNDVTYKVSEKIQTGEFKLIAELPGEVGNIDFGDLLPIDIIDGLGRAELKDVITPGIEEESDEDLLDRYLSQVRRPSTSGNANHYKQWALEVTGVGEVKIIPLWNGNGTVKVVLLGDDKRSPAQSIIDATANYIESVRPVNAVVTVTGALEEAINISATITLVAGKTLTDASNEISTEVTNYLKSIAFVDSVVRYSQIGSIILNAPSVLDYSNLQLNTLTQNIQVSNEAVAVLGTVTLS
jgi:uncharacterized phage protein gp47/JayE